MKYIGQISSEFYTGTPKGWFVFWETEEGEIIVKFKPDPPRTESPEEQYRRVHGFDREEPAEDESE